MIFVFWYIFVKRLAFASDTSYRAASGTTGYRRVAFLGYLSYLRSLVPKLEDGKQWFLWFVWYLWSMEWSVRIAAVP